MERSVFEIIDLYKKAWESHDSNLLSILFEENAVYEEKTDKIMSGLHEIQSYWEEISRTQTEVLFSVKTVHELSLDGAVLEWTAKFTRIDLNEVWFLDGLMIIQLSSRKKIRRLKECFCIKKLAISEV